MALLSSGHIKKPARKGRVLKDRRLTHLVAVVAQQTQNELEQHDKVHIQAQRAHHSHFGVGFGAVGFGVGLLDVLGVVGNKAGIDQHARAADDEIHHRRLQEHVDHDRDHQPDCPHKQETAHFGQVGFGRVRPQRGGGKGRGGDEKRARDVGTGTRGIVDMR